MGLRERKYAISMAMCEFTYIEPYFECSPTITMYMQQKKSVYLCSQTLVSHGLVYPKKNKIIRVSIDTMSA